MRVGPRRGDGPRGRSMRDGVDGEEGRLRGAPRRARQEQEREREEHDGGRRDDRGGPERDHVAEGPRRRVIRLPQQRLALGRSSRRRSRASPAEAAGEEDEAGGEEHEVDGAEERARRGGEPPGERHPVRARLRPRGARCGGGDPSGFDSQRLLLHWGSEIRWEFPDSSY